MPDDLHAARPSILSILVCSVEDLACWLGGSPMMVNEIVYNSGVQISDANDLATLSVFYDKIWLPHVRTSDVRTVVFTAQASGRWELSAVEVTNVAFHDRDGKVWSVDRFTNDWDERHLCLFNAGVLCRLPPASADRKDALWSHLGWDAGRIIPNLDLIIEEVHGLRATSPEGIRRIFLWEDHFAHLLRRDQDKPGVFVLADRAGRREIAKSALAESVLSFCLPRLGKLAPDEILEVRRLTADNREGFMAHLQSLSSALDALVKGGAKRQELEDAATDVVQTKIVPDYLEFKRQLGSARVGKAKRILDPASKLLEINSSPWAPKFWYDLVRALFLAATGATENRKEDKSNKALAFNFIRKLESKQRPELAR